MEFQQCYLHAWDVEETSLAYTQAWYRAVSGGTHEFVLFQPRCLGGSGGYDECLRHLRFHAGVVRKLYAINWVARAEEPCCGKLRKA